MLILTSSGAITGDLNTKVNVAGGAFSTGNFFNGGSSNAGVKGLGQSFCAQSQLTALSPAKVWIGVKNSDDVGLRVDLLAEVFLDATKVGQGQLNNIGTGKQRIPECAPEHD